MALYLVNDCIHFTILHSKASLCPSKSTTALAMVLILLVKRICFEEFTYAIKEINWVCLGRILGEQRHPNVDVYVLYIIKKRLKLLTKLRSRKASSIVVILLQDEQII